MAVWQTITFWGSEIIDVLGHEIILFLLVVLIHSLLFRTHTAGRKVKGKPVKALDSKQAENVAKFVDHVSECNWKEGLNMFKTLSPVWKFQPDAQLWKAVKSFVQETTSSDMLEEFTLACQQMQMCEEMVCHIAAALSQAGHHQRAQALVLSAQGSSASVCALLASLSEGLNAGTIEAQPAAEAVQKIFSWSCKHKMIDSDVCLACVNLQQYLPDKADMVESVLQQIKSGMRPSSELVRDILVSFRPRRCKGEAEVSPEDRRKALADNSRRVLEVAALVGRNLCASDPEVARMVVDSALRQQDAEMVSSIVKKQDDPWRQSVIKSLGNQNRMPDVWEVFNVCRDPTSSLHNALLDACVACHDHKAAEEVAATASRAGVADIVTFNTLAKSRIKARQSGHPCGHVSAVVDLMQAQGLKPNHVTCSILLKSLQKGVPGAEVEKVMRAVSSVEQDAAADADDVLLSSVVEGCLRVDRVDLLRPWLRKWQTSSRTTVKRTYTYGSIIRAFGLAKDVQGVWDAWSQMKQQQVAPTSLVLGCVVEALVSNGSIDDAYKVVQEECRTAGATKPVNSVIYGTLLKGFAHQKNFVKVWEVYTEMQEARVEFSIVTYNTLIDACARCNETSRMPTILQDMQKNNVEPNLITLSTVLKGYCQDRQLEKAFELLDAIRSSTTMKPDEIIYNSLLDGCAREGLWQRALGLLQQMQKDGIKPSNFTLSVLTKCARRGGSSVAEALQLCDNLCGKYGFRLNVHVYANLLHLCADRRQPTEAFNLFKRMVSARVRPDPRSYQLLIRALVDARAVVQADSVLRAALKLRGGNAELLACVDGDAGRLRPEPTLPRATVTELVESIVKSCTGVNAVVGSRLQEEVSTVGFIADKRCFRGPSNRARV
jgi:pentatricopeptide repeat protein